MNRIEEPHHRLGRGLAQPLLKFLPDTLGHQAVEFTAGLHLSTEIQSGWVDGHIGPSGEKASQTKDPNGVF